MLQRSPALATFTGNKSYIAWFWFESLTDYKDESDARKKLNDDFYSDSSTMDRLRFLQSNKITGVLIWPDDDISDDLLNKLSAQLDPAYDYVDCKGDGQKNAGVFLLRPAIRCFPGGSGSIGNYPAYRLSGSRRRPLRRFSTGGSPTGVPAGLTHSSSFPCSRVPPPRDHFALPNRYQNLRQQSASYDPLPLRPS